MAADPLPVLSGVLREQRRSLLLWGLAVAAVTAMYVGLYPSFAQTDLTSFTQDLPEGLVQAFGYNRINTPDGYLSSTIYGLLGPVLLLVFAIGTGARLIAGNEEDGTLELECTAPVSRTRLLAERLATLWLDVAVLVGVLTAVTVAIVVGADIDIAVSRLLATSAGMALLVLGFGTLALAVGAVTGRRGVALGVAAGLAVLAFMFDALGPSIPAEWMTAVSPFSWLLDNEPLRNGLDAGGVLRLAAVPLFAAAAAFIVFPRRDLMV